LKLLLVDDDEQLVSRLRGQLPSYGCELEAAPDAPRGLALALRGGFDAIILSSVLSGFDGFTLMETVRRLSPVPIIMLCPPVPGISDPRRRPDGYLPKPFHGEELMKQVQLLVNPSEAAPAAFAVH
jgi:DNA-binding response OmpR family regulator